MQSISLSKQILLSVCFYHLTKSPLHFTSHKSFPFNRTLINRSPFIISASFLWKHLTILTFYRALYCFLFIDREKESYFKPHSLTTTTLIWHNKRNRYRTLIIWLLDCICVVISFSFFKNVLSPYFPNILTFYFAVECHLPLSPSPTYLPPLPPYFLFSYLHFLLLHFLPHSYFHAVA